MEELVMDAKVKQAKQPDRPFEHIIRGVVRRGEIIARRGYRHRSPLAVDPGERDAVVDHPKSLADLLWRCAECSARIL